MKLLVRYGLRALLCAAVCVGCAGVHTEQARTDFEQGMMAVVGSGEQLRQAQMINRIRASRQLTPIYFDGGQYHIRKDQESILYQHAEELKNSPVFSMVIEGYCDPRGTDKFNVALAQRRADSTRDFLVRAGVYMEQLTTVSFGSRRLVAQGQKESAWAQNRRVEFVWGNP